MITLSSSQKFNLIRTQPLTAATLATGTGTIFYTSHFTSNVTADAAIFLAERKSPTEISLYVPALVSWTGESIPKQSSGQLQKTFTWPSIPPGIYDVFAVIAKSINPNTGAISETYDNMVKDDYLIVEGIEIINFSLT